MACQGSACTVRPMRLGPAGRGAFTTALELQEQQRLVLSFMHHMAVQRMCKNPFEDENVVGVTNYVNIGLQGSPYSLPVT